MTAAPTRRLVRRETILHHGGAPRGCDHVMRRTETTPCRDHSDGTRTHAWTESCADCGHVLRTGSVTDFEETT